MADNYLERRMEDMRSGRLAADARARHNATSSPAAMRKGMLHIAFPPRRILIALGSDSELMRRLSLSFAATGSRVALFTSDSALGSDLARNHGIRFTPIDLSAAPTSEITASATALMKAWRDIDIVITDSSVVAGVIYPAWSAYRCRYPAVSDYGGRLIFIGRKSADPLRLSVDPLLRIGTATLTCDAATSIDTMVCSLMLLSLPAAPKAVDAAAM